MDYTQILMTVIAAVLTPLLAALFTEIRNRYHAQTTEAQRQTLEAVARTAVQAAEQRGLNHVIASKKQLAIDIVQAYLDAHHIVVSRFQVEAQIEALVIELFPKS